MIDQINNHTIKLRDGRLFGYAVFGDPNGKPLFYFHGWPTSRLQAQVTDASAKKLKIRIISVDRPGYGLSDFKKNRTLLDWPDDVVELADQLKINKFAVMGVSGGGPYAAACAYKIPKRLTKVEIIVGLAPTYIPGLLDGMSWVFRVGWESYPRFPIARTIGAWLNFFYARYSPGLGLNRFLFGAKTDRKLYSDPKIRKIAKENYKEAFRQGYKGAELDLKLYTSDWGFKLKDIKVKVWLFYGEDDKNVSLEMGKYYASQIPNNKLTIYQREGHLISRTHVKEILKTLTT